MPLSGVPRSRTACASGRTAFHTTDQSPPKTPDKAYAQTSTACPDTPSGCTSDGATREEAARNVADAIAAWAEEAIGTGRPVPMPSRHLVVAGERQPICLRGTRHRAFQSTP